MTFPNRKTEDAKMRRTNLKSAPTSSPIKRAIVLLDFFFNVSTRKRIGIMLSSDKNRLIRIMEKNVSTIN